MHEITSSHASATIAPCLRAPRRCQLLSNKKPEPGDAMTGLRARVRAGEKTAGGMVFEAFGPGMGQILAAAGADFAIFDMEHTGASLETMRLQAAACRGVIPALARPAAKDRFFLSGLLDIGMKGLMVPMVESGEEAAAIVEAAKYPPLGRRGAGFGIAHDDYLPGAPAEKMAQANEDVLIIAQVETERGLANADAIAATEGIDVLWIGQFDLTSFLGVPGDFESPTYLQAWDAINAAARRHGKAMGAMAISTEMAADYRAQGLEMIATGMDSVILRDGYAALIEAAR